MNKNNMNKYLKLFLIINFSVISCANNPLFYNTNNGFAFQEFNYESLQINKSNIKDVEILLKDPSVKENNNDNLIYYYINSSGTRNPLYRKDNSFKTLKLTFNKIGVLINKEFFDVKIK